MPVMIPRRLSPHDATRQVTSAKGNQRVSRAKSGIPWVHPLTGTELRALRRLQREQEPGRYVFMSERGAPMSACGLPQDDHPSGGGREDAVGRAPQSCYAGRQR